MDFNGIFNEKYLNKLYFPDIDDPVPFNLNDFQELETLAASRHIVKSFFHKIFKKKLAVKSITIPHELNNASQMDKRFLDLIREVENFYKLGNIENIVTFYGLCIVKDHAWICMELMDLSLTNLYQKFHELSTSNEKHFPEEILGQISVQILDALIYCKSKNIMHRDVKPHNILLNIKGQIKLCDFGESRILNNSMASTFVGTIIYWPPERFNITLNVPYHYDDRADVWSLGITLLETVYGKLPYFNDNETVNKVSENIIVMGQIILNSDPKKLIQAIYADKYSNFLVDFTTKCLNKLESRPKLNELIDTEFYKKNKSASNQEIVQEFVSHYCQKAEREAMPLQQQEFLTKMMGLVLGSKATIEVNAVNGEEIPSVSSKDVLMQSTGNKDEIPDVELYQDGISKPMEKPVSPKPRLTLDALFKYAESDQTYTQYKKIKELERINIINIPGYEKSFPFNIMHFESKAPILIDSKVMVDHYLYKPTNTEMG